MLHWILTDLHLNMLMATISTFPIHVLKKMIKDGIFQRLPVQMWSARQMFMFLSPKKIMSLKKEMKYFFLCQVAYFRPLLFYHVRGNRFRLSCNGSQHGQPD